MTDEFLSSGGFCFVFVLFFGLIRLYVNVLLVDEEEVFLVSVLYLKKTKLTKVTSLGFSLFWFLFPFWGVCLLLSAGSFESLD